jgi:DNA modification methylase
VGLVSRRIGRGFLGIEIKQEYALMAAERLGWDLSRIEVIDD